MQCVEKINVNEKLHKKDRFKAEYYQTKIRYDKLHEILIKHDAVMLSFELTNGDILRHQAAAMGIYLYLLEERAELEQIKL